MILYMYYYNVFYNLIYKLTDSNRLHVCVCLCQLHKTARTTILGYVCTYQGNQFCSSCEHNSV